jgi:hypothetical protein
MDCGEIFNLLKCITLEIRARCKLKIDFPQLILDSHKLQIEIIVGRCWKIDFQWLEI